MRRSVLAAVGIALVAAGCGGGQPRPRLSHRAFVAAADRVCAQARTRTTRLAELRALRPPLADAGLYGHWLRAERDALQAATAHPDPSTRGALEPSVLLAIADGKIAGYARRLGAAVCARRVAGTIPP